jgi:hypothetical protein
LIRAELELVQANISTNPDDYRRLLASLSTEDRKIYNASFEKSINVDLGGDPAAYATMLERCGALESGCEFVQVDKQPTSDLIPLVLMVREEIPAYKAIVEGVVAQAAAAISSTMPLTTTYRPGDQTKSPYRMVEKALTKGPNRAYPDCSQILDVFGCIIDCQDYAAMAAVVDAFADQHNLHEMLKILRRYGENVCKFPSEKKYRKIKLSNAMFCRAWELPAARLILKTSGWETGVKEGWLVLADGRSGAALVNAVDATLSRLGALGQVQIARMKDRWKHPSGGGWRDLMLNIVVNGKVVFEVQVVLHAMLVARTALDAHTAYNQFRSFAEVFGLLEISMEIELAAADGNGDDSWVVGDAAGGPAAVAAAAAARNSELEAENKRLIGEVAALAVGKAAVEATVGAGEAALATSDGMNTALAAEKAAVEAERMAPGSARIDTDASMALKWNSLTLCYEFDTGVICGGYGVRF